MRQKKQVIEGRAVDYPGSLIGQWLTVSNTIVSHELRQGRFRRKQGRDGRPHFPYPP